MGSSSSPKPQDPNFSGNMGKWLDGAMQDLEGWNPTTPDRPSSDGLIGSIGQAQDQIGQAQDWYAGIMDTTIDPNVVSGIVDANQQMLGQSFAGIDTAATGGGNMGSSRAGLAQGSAAANQSQQLNQDLMTYQQQVVDNAFRGAEGATGLIGADTQFEQYLREIAQGDAKADWIGDTVGGLPNVIKGRIYSWLESGSVQGAIT
ncbi:hypothetical protein CWO07_24205 [Vibrio splendidus]|uniref:Uncharacterized protein n=1 Tax=Vibrio splendidus TaxID=29497 RepID=A0A2T5EJ86_VIBSP|nr:hypothetical protein [Vibrio splendidus]PTP20217.1 hypothetical protein CWO07_24205 [Vibrio splendidus]